MRISDQDNELADIILRSVYSPLTKEEEEKLSVYLNASAANRTKYEELTRAESLGMKLTRYEKRNENREIHFRTILKQINKEGITRPVHVMRRLGWVAAIIIVLGTVAFFAIAHPHRQPVMAASVHEVKPVKDIPPGNKGAVLTLADGSKVLLDSLGDGVVASQKGSKLMLHNGLLAYDPTGRTAGEVTYNTLTTPTGRIFNLVLPDGSKVWLNSASSIRYPTLFTGKERQVDISGEAYLEVATNRSQPFIVKTNDGTRVEVLGTSFNINAYGDEEISKTTLLEGAVKVGMEEGRQPLKNAVLLKPGQQAQVGQDGGEIKTVTADVDKVMSWKRGFFNFEDASLEDVMRQLARWYDLQVVYETKAPHIVFGGELSRNLNLSGVLQALEDSKVHFKMEDKKIIVQP